MPHMFESLFTKYATEVVQSYGEGVLWWGVKYVDYFQPELMNAANEYSDRFNDQVLGSAKYIILRSPSSPIYKIINVLIEDLIKRYGKDKVINTLKANGWKYAVKYGLQTTLYTVPITDMTYFLFDNVYKSMLVSNVMGLFRNAANIVYTVGVSYQSLQFQSVKSFTWLLAHNKQTAKQLYDMNIETLFFLVQDEYVRLLRKIKYA